MNMQRNLLAVFLAFYLGTYNGNLALWQDNQAEPVRIYPYSSSLYTRIDQEILEKRIKIHDIKTLEKHLDDYLS